MAEDERNKLALLDMCDISMQEQCGDKLLKEFTLCHLLATEKASCILFFFIVLYSRS